MIVTIADGLFDHSGSVSCGGTNKSKPSFFEWKSAPPQEARFVTESYIREAKGEGQVAWLLESFFLHPQNYLYLLEKNFDAILTYNQYFTDNTNWLWYAHGVSWIDINLWNIPKKSKNVSLITTHKQMLGHRMRREAENIPGVDVFGKGEFFSPKYDALAPYRFSITIQSERCYGFFDEKIIDCFAVGTIPIYWGCPNIGDYFNADGIVQVDSVERINSIIETLKEDFYLSRMDAIKENMENAKKYRICEDWIFNAYPHLFTGEK